MARPASPWLESVLRRLAAWQVKRPWWPLALGAVVTVAGASLATRLELRTRFDQLLPQSQPSVVELRRLSARTGGQSNVFVVLEGSDNRTLRALGDELVTKLRSLGPPWVTSAEDGVQSSRAFLEPRAGLFLDIAGLQKLRDDLDARWQWEVGEETGSNLDDGVAPPRITAADVLERFEVQHSADGTSAAQPRRGQHPDADRFPDGYYESKDRHALVVVAHTAIAPGDLDRAQGALRRIRSLVSKVHASPAFRSLRTSYAGDLVTGLAEYSAVRSDLVDVGVLGITLVLAVILVFFMRLRALLAMGVTMVAGLAWTFGATALAIGHLNVATGFLFSIVAGNGINFGIIYMARYFEERRGGKSPDEAVVIAHERTWPSTLTAAIAAAAAYGSLGVTDFHAFKHFAFIGGFGMIACWIATYALLPPVLLLTDRVLPFAATLASGPPGQRSPLPRSLLGRLRMTGARFDGVFAAALLRAPRSIASVGVALALVGAALLVPYVRSDPMQYDMRKLQNDMGQSAEMYRVAHLASDVLGANVEGAMVVMLDRPDEVAAYVAVLRARADAASAGERPFQAVHSILDFVPTAQTEKIPILLELRERLMRAHERGSIAQEDWLQIAPKLPPEDLRPFGVDDLPADLARPFTESSGIRGGLVLIEPTAGKSDADLRYLLLWADSFRETRLPTGEIVRGSGRAVIFADILRAVVRDIPRCIGLSLAMTVLAVVLTFRRGASAAAVLGALGVGVGWVALAMVATDTKIHFLNFVALPITFGIGVDYAVNVVQRYDSDGRGSIVDVLRNTGGAVVLCSLTTMLGYLALLRSINQAIRGLGILAVMGELGCLLAAMAVLPAGLAWRERNRLVVASPGTASNLPGETAEAQRAQRGSWA
jgi:predicted RND superfamily exporter protein